MAKMKGNPVIEEDMRYILSDQNIPWGLLRDKTVLISGISGFLPAYMAEALLYFNRTENANIHIIGMVRNLGKAKQRFCRYINSPWLELHQADVGANWKLSTKVNYIIHAASNASPKFYGIDPVGTILPNAFGTKNLLDLGKRDHVSAFLYFSTGDIYGEIPADKYPIREDQYGELDPLGDRACYAESKRMGETFCRAYMKQYGVPAKIVRIAHTYGPGVRLDDGRSFADFISAVVQNRDIILNSDGSARRPFLYLADATRAFFTVLLKGNPGEAYNVGYDDDISILELAQMLVHMYPEKRLQIRFASEHRLGYLTIPAQKRCLDISKVKALGWSPKFTEEEGFRRTIQSLAY